MRLPFCDSLPQRFSNFLISGPILFEDGGRGPRVHIANYRKNTQKQEMFIFSVFNFDSFSASLGAAFPSPNCLILAASYKCIIVTKQ